jgi:hypothetical protein
MRQVLKFIQCRRLRLYTGLSSGVIVCDRCGGQRYGEVADSDLATASAPVRLFSIGAEVGGMVRWLIRIWM